jgi:hypothetical protein
MIKNRDFRTPRFGPIIRSARRCFLQSGFLLLAAIWTALPASAATYNVTSASCIGPGSITQAMSDANANPGEDTISIQAGLEISLNDCFPAPPSDPAKSYAVQALESVTIEGNDATLKAQQGWISQGGIVNPDGCPSPDGYLIIAQAPGFLLVGQSRVDNSAIEVKIRNLNTTGLPAFARVSERAQLDMDTVHLDETQDAFRECTRSAIEGARGSEISLRNSIIFNFKNYGTYTDKAFSFPAVTGLDTNIDIENTVFKKDIVSASLPGAAILAVGGRVRIVSSLFEWSGGLSFVGSFMGASSAQIVNSGFTIAASNIETDRIYAGANSTVDFKASTIVTVFASCTRCPPLDAQSMPLLANGGIFNLSESAVGALSDVGGVGLLGVEGGGSFSADPLTYVQPIAAQDAAALRALTGQPALLTDPPAFLDISEWDNRDSTTWLIPLAPGTLIDRITDAGPGGLNQLLNPIDGTYITKDVLGSDRTDTNGDRNVGAVQLPLAPLLHATSTDSQVSLSWTRPQDLMGATIEGYDLCYSEVGVACAWAPVTDAPDALTADIPGLTNGTAYTFQVRARYGPSSFGPASSLVTETPYGPIGTPVLTATPGDSQVTLNWTKPDDGGHGIAGYVVWYRIAPQPSRPWTPGFSIPGEDTLNTVVIGLTNGINWQFRVRAITLDNLQSGRAEATATPWPMPNLSYASPVTVSENSIVSIPANVSNLSATPVYFLQSGLLPAGLTLNNATGEISGDLGTGTAGTYNLTVFLSQAGLPSEFDVTADLVIEVLATQPELRLHYPDIDVTAGTGPLNVGPTVTGAQGGTLSYAMVAGDILPDGLVLNPATGYITGIPTTATDGFLGLSVVVTEQFPEGSFVAASELVVRIKPTLSYAPADGEVGDPITITPVVSPSAIPGSFAITSGNLPQGLTFDPATGIVSGTPELPQFEVLTITFKIEGGQTQEVSAVLGISITDYTIDFSYATTIVTPGVPLTLPPTVSNLKGVPQYRIVWGALPAGLTLNPLTGVISGTPTESSPSPFVLVEVVDAYHSARALVTFVNIATFTANVVWNVIQEGGDAVETHNPVSITCNQDIVSASSGNISNDRRTATAILGDGEFLTVAAGTLGGSVACSAAQTITESAVETESDCQVRLLEAGSSDSCTFVNTVFFEGIPMLGDRGLAILALLMLGMGVVGVRRFV